MFWKGVYFIIAHASTCTQHATMCQARRGGRDTSGAVEKPCEKSMTCRSHNHCKSSPWIRSNDHITTHTGSSRGRKVQTKHNCVIKKKQQWSFFDVSGIVMSHYHIHQCVCYHRKLIITLQMHGPRFFKRNDVSIANMFTSLIVYFLSLSPFPFPSR